MTTTAVPTVKDQGLMSLGLVESASVNSFADFVSSKADETVAIPEKKENDFKNIFICHFIFYVIFCVSLVFYILIDLGLGPFIKNKFIQFVELGKQTFTEKNPTFA